MKNNIFILGNIIEKENIEKEVKKIIYMSYKNNFQKIKDTNLISDIGWGCTLRSTQMLIANCLLKHNFDENLNILENNLLSQKYIDIISLFLDNHLSELSIHNIVNGPIKSSIKPGNWYGPNAAIFIINKLFNNLKNTNINNNLKIIFEENRVIYYHKYIKLLDNKSILIILPMRLGINNISESYLNQLIILIKQKQFIGMVGGVKNMSYYFLGIQENNSLIYLDPHYIQEYNLEKDIKEVYHTNKYGEISIDRINTSLAVGFYCKDLNSYVELCYNIKSLLDNNEPIINIDYSKKNYNNNNGFEVPDDGVIININNNDWELL